MKRLILFFCLLAPEVRAETIDFYQSGLAGIYYGIMDTSSSEGFHNPNNRWAFRADGKFGGSYQFNEGSKLGLHADYTIVWRQHDEYYDDGDWRFYPYLFGEDKKYGKLTVGHTYNAAYLLHLQAQDISWIGVQDSNLPCFLSSVNWSNGFKSTKFITPKSTRIMDDGRAFKFSYFSPEIGNSVFGFSYTPDNASRRGMVSRYVDYEKKEDGYSTGMRNRWDLGAGKLYTSITYGMFNRTDKAWALGWRWEYGGFNIGSSYKNAYVEGNKNPITQKSTNPRLPDYFDAYREGEVWDFSMGYDFGRFKTNLAYLHTQADNLRNRDDLWVQTNRFALNEYFDVYAINAYLNSKGCDKTGKNNRGYAFITGISVRY